MKHLILSLPVLLLMIFWSWWKTLIILLALVGVMAIIVMYELFREDKQLRDDM